MMVACFFLSLINENVNYLFFSRYFLTASLKINDLDLSSSFAILSIFCRSSSSISKHALTFMISILSPIRLYYLLFLLLILNILSYPFLLDSIRKLYILIDSYYNMSRRHFVFRHLSLKGACFFFSHYAPTPSLTRGKKQREVEKKHVKNNKSSLPRF